jgi:uncharacterized membrane protein YgaE (UPF0421/DUF939 family)
VPKSSLTPAQVKAAVLASTVLAVGCLCSYWLVDSVRPNVYSASATDNALGGLWAVIATIVVTRTGYAESQKAAVGRLLATMVGFALCQIYLIFLPFHLWAFALLLGLSTLATAVLRRPDAAVTAAVTTAVVMISAQVSPEHAWRLPVLRLADTLVGLIVGLVAARLLTWINTKLHVST